MTTRTVFTTACLLLAGVVGGTGIGLGVAAIPTPKDAAAATLYEAPDVCAMPLDGDGIGFHILLDEAKRRPFMRA